MAVSNTPRFGLKKYSAGGDPHPTRDEHNAMIEAIETQAARYAGGATASRPAPGKGGTFYRDTEAARVYLDDGAGWVDISTNGGGGAGAPVAVGGAGSEGTSDRGARADHTHALALATAAVSGAMSSADKSKLDGATAAATAGRLVVRDAAGRVAVAAPSAAGDAATKGYVDTETGKRALSAHTHSADDVVSGVLDPARLPSATTATPGALSAADKAKLDAATAAATPNTLVMLDGAGRTQVAAPSASADTANKGYVDQQVNTRAPSVHTHAWADVTGKPSTFAPSAHGHSWGEISGTPATYAPSAHSHGWAEITGKPTTFSPTAHTHLWADLTDAPSTFPPSAHSHSAADITSGVLAVARLPLATQSAAGAMSAADKDKLDSATNGAWASTLVMRDTGGRFNSQRPTAADHVATKDFCDDNTNTRATWSEFDKRITRGGAYTHIKSPDGGTIFALNDSGTIGSSNIYNTNAATGSYRALWINSSGVMGYNLSSRKFKTNERDYDVPLSLLETVRPKWYNLKSDVEELGDAAPDRVNFIAEDLHDAGLSEYVDYEGGTGLREDAQTINEQLMVNALWSICRQQQEQIVALTDAVRGLGGAV
ncbi:minor tail protein [Arthrobacter phage Altadena]|uniref:Minor tail protein n=1 Tax=Arthrobacter phage Altadena TaxID=3059064 RepID=A0AA96KHL7_9CAUD|nr:minor tail protein [Arthrobacter phage Altadena]